MSEICVIIPMFGQEHLTRKCIELTLVNAGVPIDILVVDDGSPEPFHYTDGKLDDESRVITLRLDENSGYTNATNQGILWAGDRYKYLHLLNNDTEPRPDFIKILYDAMEKNPQIGIAGSARILPKAQGEHNLELFGADLIRGYQRMTSETEPLPEIIYTVWVPVCSALCRVDMFREIGILDKRMKTWCSDTDLCFRANFAGWNVALISASRVVHIHQGTTGFDINGGVSRDQQIAIQKLAGMQYAELMTKLPLDCESNVWGELRFETVKK